MTPGAPHDPSASAQRVFTAADPDLKRPPEIHSPPFTSPQAPRVAPPEPYHDGGRTSCPPGCYRATDEEIFWLNQRPYTMHRLLGRGGFGEVHEVEMLLPCGLEVDWDDNLNVKFDEEGCIMLKESVDDARSSGEKVRHQQSSSEAHQLNKSVSSSSESPLSQSQMRTSLEPTMCFSHDVEDNGPPRSTPAVREGQNLEKASLDEDTVEAIDSATHHVPGEEKMIYDFPVVSDTILQGSGVFFALKIQSARNKEHLETLVQEVEAMRVLSGESGIVQLKEHAINTESLYLLILMELGACDLHEFLHQTQYTLDVPSLCSLWQTLVHRVESLHKFDIIHRDIKPQNFILVPAKGYCDAKILARTRREDFRFRLVQSDLRERFSNQGDVELVIKEAGKEEVVLPLSIKLTDFGIARTLDTDAPHVSIPRPGGTVVFMAPEAVRQTLNGYRKVSKRVDIWALGVMLYQMLHEGKTPVGHYLQGPPAEALLAVADETVNRAAMDFDASNLWRVERTRLVRVFSGGTEPDVDPDPTEMTVEMLRALVVAWVRSEFLVRVSKRCLVFDVDDRVDGVDLRVWIDRAIETDWGLRGAGVLQTDVLLQTGVLKIDSSNAMMEEALDLEVARIGQRIGASLFPEIWREGSNQSFPSPPPHATILEIAKNGSSTGLTAARSEGDRATLEAKATEARGEFLSRCSTDDCGRQTGESERPSARPERRGFVSLRSGSWTTLFGIIGTIDSGESGPATDCGCWTTLPGINASASTKPSSGLR